MNIRILITLSVILGLSLAITLRPLRTYEGSTLYQTESSVYCAVSKMAINADGSPHAYHPHGKGLDKLSYAGKPGNWWGIATHNGKSSGTPVIQGPSDPAPGYYVSTTSLVDGTKDPKSQRRYANSETIPFMVIPGEKNSSLQ
jgi:hypothetical protein